MTQTTITQQREADQRQRATRGRDAPTPVTYMGAVKKVVDQITSISKDCETVTRDMELTVVLKDVTERQYLRMLQQRRLGHVIQVSITPLQYGLEDIEPYDPNQMEAFPNRCEIHGTWYATDDVCRDCG